MSWRAGSGRRSAMVLLLTMTVALTGCSRAIDGSAQRDPDPPLATITKDAFGIRAGLAEAPVQLELYTEPQCSHCADLQADFGDQFAYYIGTGQLALTYRPLTFLDVTATQGHSARVVNAMFTAATPGGAEGTTSITGRQFQLYVEELWSHQEPGAAGPSDAEQADLARAAGIPDQQAALIAAGRETMTAEELLQLEAVNFEFLYEVDPLSTGTPTVFDLGSGEKMDLYDDGWLSKLMES